MTANASSTTPAALAADAGTGRETATAIAGTASLDGPIVFYDGTCGLCARSVRWILRKERDHEIQFAPLQGDTAAAARARHPTIPETLESVVYIDKGRVHLRSKAFLHAARHMRAPWRWAYWMRWFPGFVLDLGYRVIAATRYRFFGRVDACELPSPENRKRFLP